MSMIRTFTRGMHRVKNFNAGPAGLPMPVLQKAHAEFFDFMGTGMGVQEMSHRSKEFDVVIGNAEEKLKTIMKIPDNYSVMFMQGGASLQFYAACANLIGDGFGEQIVTGAWSKAAMAETSRLYDVREAGNSADSKFTTIPEIKHTEGAAYMAYCDNETVHGVEFPFIPDSGSTPLVADMSSNFCSKPVDVTKFGYIYAGAQKNVGPSGVTIGIIRNDLVGKQRPEQPTQTTYEYLTKNGSRGNTPPSWQIYMCGLVFDWIHAQGGLEFMAEYNGKKAATLYGAVESSNYFHSPVDPSCRSNMNVPFRVGRDTPCEETEKKFIAEAEAAGLVGLKGHRSVGGCRASIYNAVTQEDVDALVSFMHQFEKNN